MLSTLLDKKRSQSHGHGCICMSVITDMGLHDATITHEEVLEAANAAEPKFAALFKGLIEAI